MKIQTAKGMRDFGPEEKILRDSIVKKLIRVFERYGFSPLETPLIERYDVLSAKFVAGESSDVLKEIFKLTDQGKRKLGLRFDLTIPLARFIAMNPSIKMPFKRYQIGEVFRDGPIKLGRYREFWQCDADIIGTKDMASDAEFIKMALEFFSNLGLDFYIKINNKKVLQSLLINCGVKEKNLKPVIIIIDKLRKIGFLEVKKELNKILDKKAVKDIIKVLKINGNPNKIFSNLGDIEGIDELKELFSYFDNNQLKNIKLNISLARGLEYYTGTIFEGFLRKNKISSSVCGGGRFDNLISKYLGSGDFPAVGISFGLDVISEAIKLENKLTKKTTTELYVIPIKNKKESVKIVDKLRKNINVDFDFSSRGISNSLDYANKLGIPYVLIIGKKELASKKFTLKNMKTGKEKKVLLENIVKEIKI